MRRDPTRTRLSKRDIELIIAVVDCAWRNDWPVAQVVEHRLTQNWTARNMCLEDGDADALRQISAETRRIRRLQRRFASWRPLKSAGPSLGTTGRGLRITAAQQRLEAK